MIDWLSEHAWVVWVGIAVVLAIIEMMSLDLVLLMFALGALVAAGAAALGIPLWISIIIFAAVSFLLLGMVRPALTKKLHQGPTLPTGYAELVGQTAEVLEPVDARGGRVRIHGDLWTARTEDSRTFDREDDVIVVRIEGATLVVTAKEAK